MKKILASAVFLLLFLPSFGENYDFRAQEEFNKSVIEAILRATWGSGRLQSDFAHSIYQVKDQIYFKDALKSYIEKYCSVKGEKIECM